MTTVNLGSRVYTTADHEPTDWFLVGAVALVILNGLDIIVTRYLLANTASTEGNALVAQLVLSPWAVVVKTLLPAAVGWRYVVGPRSRMLRNALRSIVAVYVAVVLWNLHWLVVR